MSVAVKVLDLVRTGSHQDVTPFMTPRWDPVHSLWSLPGNNRLVADLENPTISGWTAWVTPP